MILLRPKKLREISPPAVEPMFDDEKKKSVVPLAVLNPMEGADMTMILMMMFLGKGIGNVGHIGIIFGNLLTCNRGSP